MVRRGSTSKRDGSRVVEGSKIVDSPLDVVDRRRNGCSLGAVECGCHHCFRPWCGNNIDKRLDWMVNHREGVNLLW